MEMIEESGIVVRKAGKTKLNDMPADNSPFGRYFTDHMLEADYEYGEWKNIEIKPFQPLVISPSLSAIHYGQSVFEGIKAYKNSDGEAIIFRPLDNFLRFNESAVRMSMPPVPEWIFMDGMKELVGLDKSWISSRPEHSLYIRPFMFATDEMIGVKPADTYKFMIILSPTGPYYSKPVRIYVEEFYTRAAQGGVGAAKAAGNYGSSLLATEEAKKKGYDQILWTDATDHKYVQEIGTMNVFFIVDGKALTPDLSSGTILSGITRDSAMIMLKEMGIEVIERKISIDELVEYYKAGKFTEAFGTGTAATISRIRELNYRGFEMTFDTENFSVATDMKSKLDNIREGRAEDRYNWLFSV